MNDPTLYWSGFWSGFGSGLLFVITVAAASTILLVYLLQNFGADCSECADKTDGNVAEIEDYR